MKVLVIGGTGFTGRRVVAILVRAGHEVRCLVRPPADRAVLADLPVETVPGDLDDRGSIVPALEGRDALMYVASLGFGHAPAVVAAVRDAGVGRAVFFSTTGIFTTLPARSRAIRLRAEDTIRDSGLDWTLLRPTMIYGGPGDRNVERLFRALKRWPVLPAVAGGGKRLQPVLVDDLAAAAVESLARPACVRAAYNLAGREAVTFGEFVRSAARALGRKATVLPVPGALAIGAAAGIERLMPRPFVRAEQVRRLLEDKDFDVTPAVRDLGYRPAGIEEGLAQAATRWRAAE